jgi:hypothetical protein
MKQISTRQHVLWHELGHAIIGAIRCGLTIGELIVERNGEGYCGWSNPGNGLNFEMAKMSMAGLAAESILHGCPGDRQYLHKRLLSMATNAYYDEDIQNCHSYTWRNEWGLDAPAAVEYLMLDYQKRGDFPRGFDGNETQFEALYKLYVSELPLLQTLVPKVLAHLPRRGCINIRGIDAEKLTAAIIMESVEPDHWYAKIAQENFRKLSLIQQVGVA